MSNSSSARHIPQASPLASYRAHATAIEAAIRRVAESGTYLSGDETRMFEGGFAAFCGARHAVGTSNGTDALWLALKACGIGPGDEVITVSHTAVATVAAIELCGATPVLVDVDARSLTLDPGQLESAASERTRAVVPVHLYGQPGDLKPIVEFCQQHGARLVEDCAQAAGARYRGVRVGSVGDAGVFSFYPTKNLGALGDAGMAVTNSADLAAEMRALREYGWRDARRVSERVGRNTRIDEIQASILRAKLPQLDAENGRRRELAALYTELLAGLSELSLPRHFYSAPSVFHQYVVRTPARDALARHLREAGIGSAIHYPVPVHRQPAYQGRYKVRGSLTETERATAEVLSLPMFPELEMADAIAVTDAIRRFFRS